MYDNRVNLSSPFASNRQASNLGCDIAASAHQDLKNAKSAWDMVHMYATPKRPQSTRAIQPQSDRDT